MAQHTIIGDVAKITYVDYNNPDTSYYGQTNVKLGGQNWYKPQLYHPSRYIFFAIHTDIPAGKKVISSTLKLYSTGSSGSALYTELHYVFWVEPIQLDTLTWNNMPGGEPGGTAEDYGRINIPSNAWVSFPLNKIVSTTQWNRTLTYCVDEQQATLPDFVFNSNHAANNRPFVEVVIEDVPPDPPTPVEPIGLYKDNQSTIRFSWQYKSSVGGTQKGFDLQWSTNQISWNKVSQTTANTYYDMPAGTLPTGNIFWRVRTYNEYDEVSGYSTASAFYVIGAPANPVIQSVSSGTASPTVTWTSSAQQAYELRVRQGDNVIYSTGTVPSTETSHKITAFLADGSYIAGVRVKNEYDLWSGWGERSFSITTPKPGTIDVKTYGRPYGVRLVFAGPEKYGLIYRREEADEDYIRIGKVNAGQTEFDDYTVASGKTYVYFMRNISAQGTYADGATAKQSVRLLLTQLAPASDPSNVYMLRYNLGSPPQKNTTWSTQQAELRFEGRPYPVFERNGFRSENLSCTYWIRKYEDVTTFYDLFAEGETVLLRDNKGRKIYGVMGDIQVAEAHPGYSLTFTITRCDYNEEIEV